MPAIPYVNFDIASNLLNGHVRVLNSPAGQAEGDFTLPFSPLELENFLLRVGRPRRGVRRLDSPEQYRFFVEADGYSQDQCWIEAGLEWCKANNVSAPNCWNHDNWNQPEYPVVCLSWYEAVAYARWLAHETGLPIRLPTEAEWERATRGDDGRVYPWGDDSPTDMLLNYAGSNLQRTTAVGSYPEGASPYGALDMAGNVWEWATSRYVGYPDQHNDERENLEGIASRTLRGGSWDDDSSNVRAAFRFGNDPDFRISNVGVRLVVSPGE